MENTSDQQEKKLLRKKAIYILPNLFTTSALFFGFLSVVLSSKSQFELAAYCIFFSAFMDGLDGKVARLTGTTSEFGVQYDSLCDLVSFGMAPAMLVWQSQLQYFGRIGTGISFLILACAALRLARFNLAAAAHTQKKFFIGLPSPAAACALASCALFFNFISLHNAMHLSITILFLSVLVALLMVSRVRYFSFKEFDWAKKHPFQLLVIGVFILVVVISLPKLILFPLFGIYLLSGILYTYVYIPYRAFAHSRIGKKKNTDSLEG